MTVSISKGQQPQAADGRLRCGLDNGDPSCAAAASKYAMPLPSTHKHARPECRA